MHQYDEELDEQKKARRPGRPASAREDLLKVTIATLEREYKNGFRRWRPCTQPSCLLSDLLDFDCNTNGSSVLPELATEDDAEHLQKWDGAWAFLSQLKWVRISSDGTVQPSSFPPRSN